MKPFSLIFALMLAAPMALAQDAPPVDPAATSAAATAAGPFAATEVALDAQLFVTRPVVVFADSEADPNFHRQMELLSRGYDLLAERDVIVVTDTDPAARGEWRQRFRPRGFGLVILDKDLKPAIRKPLPLDVREITAAIDKFPLRRQEVLERFPGR